MAVSGQQVEWDEVTYLKKRGSNPKGAEARSTKAVNEAMRSGDVDTSKKYSAASNSQHKTGLNTRKLDDETEELKHKVLPRDVGKAIMKARNDKKLTMKELATKVNEKPQVVTDYENGTASPPNDQILAKFERVLGVKLRGKIMSQIGEPLSRSKKK